MGGCLTTESVPSPQVRIELNEERDNRARMQHTIAKLRNIIVAQANGQDAQQQGDPAAARFNPYIAAWYRKTNADKEFEQYPPKVCMLQYALVCQSCFPACLP